MEISKDKKFIKDNFEYHARIAAHAICVANRWSEKQMDVVYQSIMSYIDTAVASKKIIVQLCSEWDQEEETFQKSMRNEAIRRGDWDGVTD